MGAATTPSAKNKRSPAPTPEPPSSDDDRSDEPASAGVIARRTVGVLLGTASLLVTLAGVGAVIVLMTITAGFAQDLFGEDEEVAVVVEEPGEDDAEEPTTEEEPAPEEEPVPEEGAEETTE